MPQLTNRTSWLGIFIIHACILGCGESLPPGMPELHPVKLEFTQAGAPLTGAAVQLVPLDATSRWVSGGGTDALGIAIPHTHGTYPGVPAGKYKVCVTKTQTQGETAEMDMSRPTESPASIPTTISLVEEQYRLPTTTPLEIEVTGSNDQYDTFELGVPVRTVQSRPPM